jgi:hypothetical protein
MRAKVEGGVKVEMKGFNRYPFNLSPLPTTSNELQTFPWGKRAL